MHYARWKRHGDPLFVRYDRRSRGPTFWVYHGMLQRCTNPNGAKYKDYGGRGIKVCERWSGADGFLNFLADMGPRPEGKSPGGRALYSIDRIDNDGNYAPGNCRWATQYEQVHNRRKRRALEKQGQLDLAARLSG